MSTALARSTDSAAYELKQYPIDLTDAEGNAVKIEMRASDGYVNVTKMCNAMGRKWKNYYCAKETKSFLGELANEEGTNIENGTEKLLATVPAATKALVEPGKNRYQSTWAHPDVSLHLAQWISSKFGVRMTKWYRKFLSGQVTTEDSTAAASALVKQVEVTNGEGNSTETDLLPWAQERLDGIVVNKARSDVTRSVLNKPGGGVYAKINNVANQIGLGFTQSTKMFKSQNNIPAKASLADYMNEPGLHRRLLAESAIGLWLVAEQETLSTLSQSQFEDALSERKRQICASCGIFEPRQAGLVSIAMSKTNVKHLKNKRKYKQIEPSVFAKASCPRLGN